MPIRWFLAAALCLAIAGCSAAAKDSARAPLSERQRDSVLARTPIPGASTVGRAMDAGDDQARRAGALNAQVDSLPR